MRSRGHLLVGRRPHRGDPADQCPGALGPLEDEAPGRRRSSASSRPCRARSRPCPTRVLCRSRLPNEDCHACRSASPARTWSRASPAVARGPGPARPAPRARAGAWSTGESTCRPGPGAAGSARRRARRATTLTRAPCSSQRRSRRGASAVVAQLRGQRRRRGRAATGARPPAAISATSAAASARSARRRARLAAEAAGRPPGDHPCPGRVLAQQRPGQGELALGLEGAQPAGAVGRRRRAPAPGWPRAAGRRRSGSRRGPARRWRGTAPTAARAPALPRRSSGWRRRGRR